MFHTMQVATVCIHLKIILIFYRTLRQLMENLLLRNNIRSYKDNSTFLHYFPPFLNFDPMLKASTNQNMINNTN